MHGDARGAFSQAFIRFTEPIVFGKRPRTLAAVAAVTAFMVFQALHLKTDAGLEKQLPLGHPYIKVFKQYQSQFGGANTVLVAVEQKQGDIYEPVFLETLRKVTDAVFFLPGMDRARVSSLFTPDVRVIEVVEGGFKGGNIVPADYQPTPEAAQVIRENVGKANIIGRYVTNDQTGAMVFSELLEHDPVTDEKLDYVRTAHKIEEVRRRFTTPKMYQYKLKEDFYQDGKKDGAAPTLKAGDIFARMYSKPGDWLGKLENIESTELNSGSANTAPALRTYKLDIVEVDNPDYNANIGVHVIGFAKVVGDISDATLEVVGFFGLTLLLTWFLLWQYCGSLKIAMIPLSCSVLAVIWELGLLHTFGFGLDPFAILVPFLVLSIGVSHGVQITSFWLYEVADHGRDNFEASRATYRRLVIPGISAVLTNVVGFGTILLVPIGIVREMAINAMFGLVAIIVCKKILLPCLLSYATLKDPKKFREHQARRDKFFEPLWHFISAITLKPVATGVLIAAVLMTTWAAFMRRDLKIGELHAGVPELRPDSVYNKDTAYIAAHFALGVDIFKVIAEDPADGCIQQPVMDTIDRYAWRMENTAGVQSTLSMAGMAKVAIQAFNEGNPKWRILSRNKDVLVIAAQQITPPTGLLNENCSGMPIFVFMKDHKAETIHRVVAAHKQFIEDEAKENPGSPVKFQLATGNVGVMAAANDVIEETEIPILGWVFLGIALCVWLSFRSFAGMICVLVPLAMVSMLSYAVMVFLQIGLKVSTLPVAAFAAGIGVDYGIYIFSVLEECYNKGMSLRESYEETLHQTGKAVVFTALTLSASVATWLMSGLQFQVDMGILLTIMFFANAVAAVLLLPAFAAFLLKRKPPEPEVEPAHITA